MADVLERSGFCYLLSGIFAYGSPNRFGAGLVRDLVHRSCDSRLPCPVVSRHALRETYIFDKPTDTYRFTRQYLYKKEVIEGTLTQFRGAGVRTFTADDSESYSVTLHQGGMFLGGAGDQLLRESIPIMNSWDTEAGIANSSQEFLNIQREDVTA